MKLSGVTYFFNTKKFRYQIQYRAAVVEFNGRVLDGYNADVYQNGVLIGSWSIKKAPTKSSAIRLISASKKL